VDNWSNHPDQLAGHVTNGNTERRHHMQATESQGDQATSSTMTGTQMNQMHVQQTQAHQPTVLTVDNWPDHPDQPDQLDDHVTIDNEENKDQIQVDTVDEVNQFTSSPVTMGRKVPMHQNRRDGDSDGNVDVENQAADEQDSVQYLTAARTRNMPNAIHHQQHLDSSTTTQNPSTSSHVPNRSIGQGNAVKMMKTAIKLVCCISLGFYLTYIPGVIVTFKVLGEISIVDMELGRYPDKYHLIRIFYFFAITLGTIINPFFHFSFNRPLTRALYKMLHIKMPAEWADSTT
jgi:hypothetical protein